MSSLHGNAWRAKHMPGAMYMVDIYLTLQVRKNILENNETTTNHNVILSLSGAWLPAI